MRAAGGRAAGSAFLRWVDSWLTLVGSSCCVGRSTSARRAMVERYESGDRRIHLRVVDGGKECDMFEGGNAAET
jgi:hypothetical protein